MSNKFLYHGAIMEVQCPLVNYGRPELDFGPGFYMTHDREQAENWAKTKATRKTTSIPVLNVYHFDEETFWQANYTKRIFAAYNKEWLDFIAQSRKGQQPWEGIDWIEGGIANDSVISTVDAYVDNFITAEQAINQLVNEDLRHQVCVRKQEIVDKYLHFIESVNL